MGNKIFSTEGLIYFFFNQRKYILSSVALCCQERELVLKRIAEDRKSLQEKTQTSAVADAPPSSQAQKLGGKIQTNVDNNCILMVRL